MADLVIANYEDISNIADAVRTKTGSTEQMELSEIATNVLSINTGSDEAVLYVEQTLTDEQKTQARTNIGALSADTEIPSIDGLATEEYVDNAISAIPTPDVSGQIDAHNTSSDAHSDIRTLINDIVVPTKVSELTNDTGYLTSYTETDPTVPAWAKASVKPTYTASEVGADAAGSANEALEEAKSYVDSIASTKSDSTHNHDSVYDAKGSADTALTSANSYTDSAVAAVKNDLLNGAGAAYDTLKELGDLIDDNTDAITALETVAATKTNIIVDATSGNKSITLTADNVNSEWRYVYASGITTLTLSSSGNFGNATEAYYSIAFLSGTTASTFTNTLGAYFTGDDCVDGVFTPFASKAYEVSVWWNGLTWEAITRGV